MCNKYKLKEDNLWKRFNEKKCPAVLLAAHRAMREKIGVVGSGTESKQGVKRMGVGPALFNQQRVDFAGCRSAVESFPCSHEYCSSATVGGGPSTSWRDGRAETGCWLRVWRLFLKTNRRPSTRRWKGAGFCAEGVSCDSRFTLRRGQGSGYSGGRSLRARRW